MATKGRYFSVGKNKKAFDSKDFKKEILKQAEAAFEFTLDNEIFFIKSELEDVLEAIGELSPNRGRGFYKARYDNPINKENSPIKVIKRINKQTGQYSASIRVLNDKFNILDLGSPARTASKDKPMRFPRYSRARTIANELAVRTTTILDSKSQSRPAQTSSDLFGPNRGAPVKQVIAGWVTTTEVAPIQARNFILTVANKVRKGSSPFVKIRIRKG